MVVATTNMHVVTAMEVMRIVEMAVPVRRQVVIAVMAVPTLHHDYRPLITIMSPVRMAVARIIVVVAMTIMMMAVAMRVMTIIVIA